MILGGSTHIVAAKCNRVMIWHSPGETGIPYQHDIEDSRASPSSHLAFTSKEAPNMNTTALLGSWGNGTAYL